MSANIRQIEGQRVENEREITGSEAEEILRKYGQGENKTFSTRIEEISINPSQTFEEMVKSEELKREREDSIRDAKVNGPKPITFGSTNGYESEIKYGSDDELGFGFKIEISTDMKIPKY